MWQIAVKPLPSVCRSTQHPIRPYSKSLRLWSFSFGSRSAWHLWRTWRRFRRFLHLLLAFRYGLGFLGNLFSLIVFFTQQEFRKISTGLLFLLITVFNTIHLWTLTTEFLLSLSISVYSSVFMRCRVNYFVQNVSRAVSTYLAVTVTLDRLIRSEFPLRSRKICTHRNVVKLAVSYVVVFSFLFSFWFCPLNTINPSTGTCFTGQSPIYNYFINNIFFPVRFIVVCLLPAALMIAANVRVLLNIRRSRCRVVPTLDLSNEVANSARLTPLDRVIITIMLINGITFVLTQIPFHLYTVIVVYNRSLNAMTYSLVRAIFLICSSIYFGIGFYAYCLATPLFRELSIQIIKNIILRRRIR